MDVYQCSLCPKVFSRQEHVRRHESTHKAPEFQCTICSRPFHRKDALAKHSHTHTSGSSLLQRRARACSSCSTSKARCTGTLPCTRCATKHLDCAYPMGRGHTTSLDSGYVQNEEVQISQSPSAISPIQPQLQNSSTTFTIHDSQSYQVAQPLLQASIQHHHTLPQTSNATHVTQQTPYYPDNATFYGLHQSTTIPIPDWTSNIASTINWLEGDMLDFNENDLSSMFPFFPGDLQFSPSADLPTSMVRVEPEAPAAYSHTNTTAQQHSPYPANQQQNTSVTSPSTIADAPTAGSGEYYVDGDLGRLPKSKRRKITPITRLLNYLEEPEFSLHCDTSTTPWADAEIDLPEALYVELCSLYQQLCLETTMFKPFHQAEFPPKAVMEQLLSNYFTHFDQTMPFLHCATFSAASRHLSLLLAMMALGSSYMDSEDNELLTLSLHEFVRRYLLLMEGQKQHRAPEPESLAQAQLLHAIGAAFTLYEPLRTSASSCLYLAARYCHDNWTRQLSDDRYGPAHESQWTTWVKKEELTRTGFCIWMLDCLLASHFHQPPHLRLDDATSLSLPCSDGLWSARDASQWSRLRTAGTIRPATLLDSLRNLYIDKRLLANLGEFSRILLIYGLYHRTWEVQANISQSLSSFEPTAQKQSSSEIEPKPSVWPPANPLFNRWRNSACDCLDVLHWSANAQIGTASGIEHPTVLHLHMARVILLAPMRSIVLYAQSLTSSTKPSSSFYPSTSSAEAEDHRRLIQRWALQDQYKARLAAIHAGVIFWHVRLYSINAFYEPTTVAFAALLFWALSAFSAQKSKSRGQSSERGTSSLEQDSPSSDVCDIILIDRPTDDELVQQFVRQGHAMRANIKGVGNLFGPAGPRKVLGEGQKLLSTVASWRGIADFWIRHLSRLEKVTAMAGVNNSVGELGASAR